MQISDPIKKPSLAAVYYSIEELNDYLSNELRKDVKQRILASPSEQASFYDFLCVLTSHGYIYTHHEEGKPVFERLDNCDPRIIEAIWTKDKEFESRINSLKYKVRYEERMKRKALAEIKRITSSKKFRMVSALTPVFRRVAYPVHMFHIVRAKILFAYASRKRRVFASYIYKLQPHIGRFDTAESKINYIDKWMVKTRNIEELEKCYWSMKDELPSVTCYVGWALWRNRKEDRHLANSVKAQLTYLGKMYESRDFSIEVDASVGRESLGTRRISDEINHLECGFPLPARRLAPAYSPGCSVLYLLHNSLPYNSGGYATRTQGLLVGINSIGDFEVSGVSRPGFPTDHKKYISKPLPTVVPLRDVINGVCYFRCDQSTRKSIITFSDYVDSYAAEIEKLATKKRVSIIHAASNFPNAYAAIVAARNLGIKSVYEVRGLWEITRLSRQSDWSDTEQFKYTAKMEAEACKQADKVITITNALKELMVSRGVPEEKITVVPNCVHTDRFTPHNKDEELGKRLGISRKDVVIGYIGSIVNYEGLDDLFKALRLLVDREVVNFHALIVGDGAVLPQLKRLVSELRLESFVTITGRVPHEEVQAYYSLVDIAPFPRKPYEVCEKVSPLKPFEAMASEKAVLVSSCAALTEIVENEKTGLVFEKGNIIDFSSKLESLIQKPDLRVLLGQNARRWVCENRDWKNGASIVNELYSSL
ncbi:glycosyltransferase [Microbulbifer salipaludis]|uniref:Glycosyltransferase n=1 Tax=Microbulbifer salipaludis TaxID=187980 RepID=A0ABS3E909_9GAMM|nr:glycosyltransferase family 4 protein [Microbulbifer salipaludis]MBN8431787.1 glycosyltransferase [Microbulbifer salipaludis]